MHFVEVFNHFISFYVFFNANIAFFYSSGIINKLFSSKKMLVCSLSYQSDQCSCCCVLVTQFDSCTNTHTRTVTQHNKNYWLGNLSLIHI